MILIGLAGRKGAGKNETARLFAKNLPDFAYYELAFADPLKDEICKAFNITRGELELHKLRWRGLMQWWGTEYKRWDNKNYWTDKWLEKLSALGNPTPSICITTDVRFENEYHLIKQLGGYLFRVRRPSSTDDKHTSETAIDNIPMANIDNFRDLEYLEQQVKQIITKLKLI